MTTQAIQALKTHKATQAEEKLKLGENWQDHGLVFCSEIGTHVRHENLLRRSYRGILIKAELPYRNFHNLRHSAATHLLKQNIHPKIVSEMLGHSHIGITMDLYSHCTPDMQKQAAEAMQSIFEG